MGCSQSSSSAVEEGIKEVAKRRQSVVEPPPVIQVNVGSNVKFQPPPHTKIVAILGKLLSLDLDITIAFAPTVLWRRNVCTIVEPL